MGKAVGGDTCFIKVDGIQLTVSGDVQCSGATVTRTPLKDGNYTEAAVVPSIQVTVLMTPDLPIGKITEATDLTVTANMANGKVRTLRNAFVSGEVSENHSDGTIQFTFSGVTAGTWK